ncbi:MAG: glucosamine-6-phosphate deaminase [bacterium]|nr:glucosamine-6-phosphate deaminase [Planctomycetota bacterium]HIL53285.1 glucosamine-6-phosphate deaminase [Planctomycetota bacterium]
MPTQLESAPIPTYTVADPREAALCVVNEIAELLAQKPNTVLGLATGNTPILVYRELVRRVQVAEISFSRATIFNLDEYAGLKPQHSGSFRAFMEAHLMDAIDLDPSRWHTPKSCANEQESATEAARIESLLETVGGIDLQLLGLGRNGHIAFNEPGSQETSRTRRVRLSEDTRAANRPDFPAGEEVPSHALTMGIGTILEARRLRILAFGPHKADAVAGMLQGPRSKRLPASFLRAHGDAELWLDESAAGALSLD